MKRILFTILGLLILILQLEAQTKSQVISDVIKTMDDFAADISFINENSEYADDNIHSVSKMFGSPDYFLYNDKQIDSFQKWLKEYCYVGLNRTYVEHSFRIKQHTFEKVAPKEKQDKRYQFDAILTRKSDNAINDERKISFVVEWKGNDSYVAILEIKGELYQQENGRTIATNNDNKTNVSNQTEEIQGFKQWLDKEHILIFIAVAIVIGWLLFCFFSTGPDTYHFLFMGGLVIIALIYFWPILNTPKQLDKTIIAAYDLCFPIDSLKVARVSKDNKWGLIDYDGKVLLPLEYQGVGAFCEYMTWIQKDNKVGYINNKGEVMIATQYDGGNAFHNGQTLVYVQKNSYTRTGLIIDKLGNVIRSLPYTRIEPFKGNYAKVIFEGYGYIRDKDYKEVIPAIYDNIGDLKFGHAIVQKKNKQGVVDSLGNVVVPLEYEYISFMDKDRINISKEIWEKEALVNMRGEWIVKFGRFNRIDELSQNRMAVRDGHKWGYIDRDGKVVIPLKYNRAETFSEGVATVRIGKNHGCVDLDGNLVIPMIYDEILSSKQGLMAAQKGDKWGFINQKNETVIPFKYRRVTSFGSTIYKQGTTEVLDEKGYGIIDINGKEIIPCLYNGIIWEKGFYLVKKNKKWGVMDESGNVVHSFIYDKITTDKKSREIWGTKGTEKIKLETPIKSS